MKRFVGVAVGFLLIIAMVQAVAQPGMRGRGPGGAGMERGGDRLVEELNLTPDQQAKFRTLQTEFQKSMVRMHADVRLARIDLGELMGSEKPDKSAIARKMKEVADLEYKIETAQLDHQFAIRGMLTEEQLKEFKQMHPRMGYGQRFHEGRGHGCYCGACGEEVGRGPHGPGFAPFPDDDE